MEGNSSLSYEKFWGFVIYRVQTERVTGRKVRKEISSPVGGNRLQVSETCFISLKSVTRKQITSVRFFSLLYTKLKGGCF